MRTLNGVDGPADVLEPLYSFCESSALYFASEDLHLRPLAPSAEGIGVVIREVRVLRAALQQWLMFRFKCRKVLILLMRFSRQEY